MNAIKIRREILPEICF